MNKINKNKILNDFFQIQHYSNIEDNDLKHRLFILKVLKNVFLKCDANIEYPLKNFLDSTGYDELRLYNAIVDNKKTFKKIIVEDFYGLTAYSHTLEHKLIRYTLITYEYKSWATPPQEYGFTTIKYECIKG